MKPEVKRFPNLKALSNSAAELILKVADEAIAERGAFTMAMSGGETPRGLYEVLAGPPYKDKMQWDKVHLFWVDERCVSDTHPESNFNMAFMTLISKVPLLTRNVRPILANLGADEETANMYEQLLRSALNMEEAKGGPPSFDMILLGIGPDGHTASLFPNSPAAEESEKWVVAVPAPAVAPPVERITMTFPVINNARNVAILVSGSGKKEAVRAILEDREKAASRYPAARVNPSGNLYWLLDEESV